jgi:nucleoside-diphosphate-sugar epimerase
MSRHKRVLITGASGFIGRATIPELLSRGFEVHAVCRRPQPDLSPQVVSHVADLLEQRTPMNLIDAVQPSHLLHLAWNTTPGKFWWAPENLEWLASSLRLYRAFADIGGHRAVFAGTCAEYDWNFTRLDEATTPLNPSTLYGTAKNALRCLVEVSARREGVSVAWGRIFFVYGPHEQSGRLLPDVISALLQGRPAQYFPSSAQRDFTHVEDVGRALVAILENDWQGAVNIASGNCVGMENVLTTIADLLSCRELLQPRLESVDGPLRLEAATQILNDRIGFTSAIGLQEGLASTIDWWRKNIERTGYTTPTA